MRKKSVVMPAALVVALLLLGFAKATPDPAPAAARPVFGGTLKVVAAFGPNHIDPVPAYFTADYVLERAYARQLVSYPAVPDRTAYIPGWAYSPGWTADITPTADAATTVPTAANGGITNGGRTYTFHIRPGVEWNTDPPRHVVAQDFLREFKAFCNPVSPVGNLGYYTNTIKGMQAYCAAEASHFAHISSPTAEQIAAFQNSHAISGIATPDSSTIRFDLLSPTPDFLNILALPFASARPVEYDSYLPDSLTLDQHTISDGPYQITSYVPGSSIVMQRNPAWRQSSDPIRHQYVDTITVAIGVTDISTQETDLRSNVYDVMDNGPIPLTNTQSLSSDPDFHIWPGGALLTYVVFNLRSPNSGGAIAKVNVRRAIEFGVNKAAIAQVLGGPATEPIANSVIPAGNAGHLTYNPYPSPGRRGDPTRCRALLAKAGFRHGLKLKYLLANDSLDIGVFHAIRASLSQCGITMVDRLVPQSEYFLDLLNAPVNNKPGTWDMGQPAFIADWFGIEGRSLVDPLFRTHCVFGTSNYGCYNSSQVDRLMSAAESARTATAASNLWLRVDAKIMRDAAIIPLVAPRNPNYASPEVHQADLAHGVVFLPNLGGPDITNLWIKR